MLGTGRGTEPVGREVCPWTGGVIQDADACEMNDAKRFTLSERQFLEFARSLIGFRLAVRRAGQLIVGMNRVGGPLAQAIIGARRAYELHRAQREQENKHTVPEVTEHDALPQRKSGKGITMSTCSAIPTRILYAHRIGNH